MIEKILELARRAGASAEAFYSEGESRRADFDNNRLKYITTKSIRGVGLRVIRDGRIGFSSTTDLSRPERLVEHALESARYGQEAKFEFPAGVAPAAVPIFDRRVPDYPIEDGVRQASEAIEKVRAAAPRGQCSAEVSKHTGRQRLLNSAGLDVSFEFSRFTTGLGLLLVRDGSLLWTGDDNSSCAWFDRWDAYVGKVLSDVRCSEREIVPEPGVYPVVFTPDALDDALLETFENGVNGKLVQKRISPLSGKIGQRITDARFTLADDPTLDFAQGSAAVDCEGVAARRNVLIEAGVLKAFIYDLQTAGVLGEKSTGNGMRGFAGQPAPSTTNLVIDAGDTPVEKMIAGMERGLLVDQLIGAGQSNVLAGEFSVNVGLGFLVERGEIVARVKDCMLAGNVFEVFNNIAALGSLAELKGDLKAPHVQFAGLSLASG